MAIQAKEKTAISVGAELQSSGVPEGTSKIYNLSVPPAGDNFKKKFQSIDGETLMGTSLPPIQFVVSTLLPQGLSILAGAPKVGKSWLALQICLAVAKGEPLWDLPTQRGTTLYLCLEDSYARIQSRLFDVGDDAPANIHFVILADSIGSGLEEQIESFLSVHPHTSLIAIDTLQKVRSLSSDNAYAADYHDIGLLKAVADKHSIVILLIHHLRKQSDDDPMNMVSGTTGITGAVDNSFVLKESKRGSGRATLYCTGRDIEYRELELTQDKLSHCWELHSDSLETPDMLLDNMVCVFSEFIKTEREFNGTPTELVEKLQSYSSDKIISNVLSKRLLQNQYELERIGIHCHFKRSNGKRLISATYRAGSDDSDDTNGIPPTPQNAVPVDPAYILSQRST